MVLSQLSYGPVWVLPLYPIVETDGIEPTTPGLQGQVAIPWNMCPRAAALGRLGVPLCVSSQTPLTTYPWTFGGRAARAEDGTRTRNPQLGRLELYH